MSADLELLLEPIRSAKRGLRRAALGLVAFGLLTAVPSLLLAAPLSYVAGGVAALCLFLGGLLLKDSSASPDLHPSIIALRSPRRVSWVFLEQTRNAHTQVKAEPVLRLGVVDTREQLMLPIIPGREAECLRAAASVAPWATTGWTPDLELAFARDPQSLLDRSAP